MQHASIDRRADERPVDVGLDFLDLRLGLNELRPGNRLVGLPGSGLKQLQLRIRLLPLSDLIANRDEPGLARALEEIKSLY